MMASGTREAGGRSYAPRYNVPADRIVSIEHPCIVQNFDNGFKSLGGEAQLEQVLRNKVDESNAKPTPRSGKQECVVGVSLRPHDPLAKKIASTGVATQNVLIKVALPKWTGRKRKRGSDGPFVECSSVSCHSRSLEAPQLLRRMRDNASSYSIEPVGMITDTHRFRSQPDFQMLSDNLPMMQRLKASLAHASYASLKDLQIDLSPGPLKSTEYPLPPSLTPAPVPYRYDYRQAPYVVYKFNEDGVAISQNASKTLFKGQSHSIAADALEVPQEPPSNRGPALRISEEKLSQCIEQLKQLLEKRPLVSSRLVTNTLKDVSASLLREIYCTVGYMFSNGPWRDLLIKYGVDPRTDPKYRFYQALLFQMDSKVAPKQAKEDATSDTRRKTSPNSHIFDGTVYMEGGKVWQLCDITDPLLYRLLHENPPRAVCDPYASGWIQTDIMAKVRVIMKDKLNYLASGQVPPEQDYLDFLQGLQDKETTDAPFDGARYNDHVRKLNSNLAVMIGNLNRTRQAKESGRNHRPKTQAQASEDGGNGGAEDSEEDDGIGEDDELEFEEANMYDAPREEG